MRKVGSPAMVMPHRAASSFANQISETYFPYEITAIESPDHFLGKIDSVQIGPCSISRAYANTSFTGRNVPECTSETVVLHWMTAGHLKFVQDRREVLVSQGQAILLRSDRPFLSRQFGEATAYALNLPANLLRSRYPDLDAWFMNPLDTDAGMGAMLRDGLTSFWKNARLLNNENRKLSYSWLADLLGASFQSLDRNDDDKVAIHLRRVMAIIAEDYSDPELDIGSVSDRMGISRSYLYAMMNRAGETFSKSLISYRLDRAAELMFDTPRPNMQKIAAAVGFKSPSHFSRSFTQHFGACPRTFIAKQKNSHHPFQ